MTLAEIHPELRTAFRLIPPFPLHQRWFCRLSNWLLQHAPQRRFVGEVAIRNEPLSNSQVRIYHPPATHNNAGLLWIHGGGLVIGAASQDDGWCARLALTLGIVVVSVDYRLAPECPYPAAIDDCLEAWQWFQQSAGRLQVDPAQIAIAGQSAGGGLAACLAHRVYDIGGVQPVAVALFCAMLDDRPAARRELDAQPFRIWTNQNNRAGWSAYLSRPPGAPEVPPYAVANRRKDLTGLPPTWIAVSDIDLLHDENIEYHERQRSCGVLSELYRIPQAPHGFEALLPNSRLAKELYQAAARFLACRLMARSTS